MKKSTCDVCNHPFEDKAFCKLKVTPVSNNTAMVTLTCCKSCFLRISKTIVESR